MYEGPASPLPSDATRRTQGVPVPHWLYCAIAFLMTPIMLMRIAPPTPKPAILPIRHTSWRQVQGRRRDRYCWRPTLSAMRMRAPRERACIFCMTRPRWTLTVFSDSIEFSGAAPPAYAMLLQLLEVTLKVCHPQYRPNDVRVTRAKTSSPDPRKSDDHYRFPK